MLGRIYLDLGDDDRAETWILRAVKLNPDSVLPTVAMQWLHLFRGEKSRALAYARKVYEYDPSWYLIMASVADQDLNTGMYAEARARYERHYPSLLNDNDPQVYRTNVQAVISLAFILSNTDEQMQADLLLDRSLALFESIPRLGIRGYGIADVKIYAQRGMTEEALAALREAIDQGWRTDWWYYLEHDFSLQPLHDEPEYQAMVEEIRADMAAQLARVRAVQARGELVLPQGK